MKPPSLPLLILLASFLQPLLSTRRNSKFAKEWTKLDKVKGRSTIKRHISSHVKLKNSPIHYISLPPNPYSFVPGLGYISPAAKPTSHVFSHSLDNTGKVQDEKEPVKKLNDFNLEEYPKTGNGVKLENVKPEKKVNFKSQKYSKKYLMNLKKKLQKEKESVIRPKVPFVLNGKPFNPHAMKNKQNKKNKKKNNNRIAFPSNGKPYNVYELRKKEDKKSKLKKKKATAKNKNQKIVTKPSKYKRKSEFKVTKKPKLKTKPTPTNSPIFTYKLPPAFSINSLRSLLTKTKEDKNHVMSDKILDMIVGTSTTSITTTSTTTTTTTTTATTRKPESPKYSGTNSPIYTYKLPSLFSMNSLRSLLTKNKSDQSDSFSLKHYINILGGVSAAVTARKTTTTTTTTNPTTTTTSTTTTTTQTTTGYESVKTKPASSPLTWLAGQFNGIPTKIFHFRAPFSMLSWLESLKSSQYPGEDIIRRW